MFTMQMAQAGQTTKIIDWESFYYALSDHRIFRDPNRERAAIFARILEDWLVSLHAGTRQGTLRFFSRDGKAPKRFADIHDMGGDSLIGSFFDTHQLLSHFHTFARGQVEGAEKTDSKIARALTLFDEAVNEIQKGLASIMPGELTEVHVNGAPDAPRARKAETRAVRAESPEKRAERRV